MTEPQNGHHEQAGNFRDFTPHREPVRFRIDDDVFEGLKEMPALLALRFASQVAEFETRMEVAEFGEPEMQLLTEIFHIALKPDSAKKLLARLEDLDNPVGIDTFLDLVPWLLERYGLRPTGPSSSPPGGSPPSPDDGTNLTGILSGADLTSNPSDSTGS